MLDGAPGSWSVTHKCGTCNRSLLSGGRLAPGEAWPCGHSGIAVAVYGGPDSLDVRDVWPEEQEPAFAERLAAYKARKADAA